VRNYHPETTAALIVNAESLLKSIDNFYEYTQLIALNIEQRSPHDDAWQKIELIFESHQTPPSLIRKLTSVQEVYSILCRITGTSEQEYPLGILKAETGSLILVFLGAVKAITVLKPILEKAALYYYDNFTPAGRGQQLEKRVEILERMVKLREILIEQNVFAEGSEEDLRLREDLTNSTVRIAESFNSLIEDEMAIQINREEFSVAESQKIKYLNALSRTNLPKTDSLPQLEDGKKEDDIDIPPS
jgi:hypothetical protein